MAGRGEGPEFIEALARGLDVIRAFGADRPRLTLAEVAAASDLARPTARRILLTLTELGYVRADGNVFSLTARVLELGMAYVGGLGLWDVAQQHMRDLVAVTGESSSISQLDGSDIVYVARVAVPVRDGSGAVRAAMNVTVHSAETSVRTLLERHLPPLREAASAVSADWAAWQGRPQEEAGDRPARTLVR